METNTNRREINATHEEFLEAKEEKRQLELAPKTENNWEGARWLALYTNPRAEKQVAANLERGGYEYYLPLMHERHQWADRMKWVDVPLIPSYIFARITETQLSTVRNIDGIVMAICEGKSRRVALIPDQQMADFQEMVAKARIVRVVSAGEFRKGVTVEVVAGDFKGKRGKLVSVDGESLFTIELQGVSINIGVVMEAEMLKIITK